MLLSTLTERSVNMGETEEEARNDELDLVSKAPRSYSAFLQDITSSNISLFHCTNKNRFTSR